MEKYSVEVKKRQKSYYVNCQFSSVFTKTVSLIMQPIALSIDEPPEKKIQVETKCVEKLLQKTHTK